MQGFFVTGTDTDVGKTVASAWLMLHTGGAYWKPVQTGIASGISDRQTVQRITLLGDDRFFPSIYELKEPLSPHEAARRENVEISLSSIVPPQSEKPLIVEGAGGVMVPLNREEFMTDLIAALKLPVILVCRSTLGTINHTLLSLRALEAKGIAVSGIIINGPKSPHNRAALEEYGRVPVIAEIPLLGNTDRESLLAVRAQTCLK